MRNGGNLKMLNCKLRLALIASPIALLAIVNGSGAMAQTRDPKLLALLPPYCKYTTYYNQEVPGGNDVTQIERWRGVMGPQNFVHLHHYCFGLENTNRALYFSSSKQDRDRELRASLNEFDYVINRVAADFALLPEILTRRGENLLRLGNAPRALLDLNRAIELKPDHWPPYAALSDYYKGLGELDSAREWAEKGLSAAPGARPLQRRLAELGKPGTRRAPSAD
jgi:tetratricopeptide (TPR) repeat protein